MRIVLVLVAWDNNECYCRSSTVPVLTACMYYMACMMTMTRMHGGGRKDERHKKAKRGRFRGVLEGRMEGMEGWMEGGGVGQRYDGSACVTQSPVR